jgi:DNA invertase Pin-like site-specific DNA recombinase
MQHVAYYTRVSSRQQDTTSQEPDMKRHANAQGEKAVWYSDKFTGKTMDRPGWEKLMRAVREGQASRIVVWRLDRLGRTAKGLTALFDELVARKVTLVSLKDGIDLGTAAGRMLANVLASIAQFETELRGERVLAGQAVARIKGVRWGGSEKGRRIKVKDEQVEIIRRMYAENKKIAAIARATGLSRQTVYQYLPAA